jgi:hypothetical protein
MGFPWPEEWKDSRISPDALRPLSALLARVNDPIRAEFESHFRILENASGMEVLKARWRLLHLVVVQLDRPDSGGSDYQVLTEILKSLDPTGMNHRSDCSSCLRHFAEPKELVVHQQRGCEVIQSMVTDS